MEETIDNLLKMKTISEGQLFSQFYKSPVAATIGGITLNPNSVPTIG